MHKSRFFGLLSCAAVALAIAIGAYYWREIAYSLQERDEINGLRERWGGNATFARISQDDNDIRNAVASAISAANTNSWIEGIGEDKLASCVILMLDTFHGGDWETYRRFHFPVPSSDLGSFDTNRMSIIRRAYANRLTNSNAVALSTELSDEDVFIEWGKELAKELAPAYGHKTWEAIDLKNVHFSFVITNQVPSLHAIARGFEPLRTTSVFESIDRFPKDSPTKFAMARIPVKTSEGKVGIYPIYAVFYWFDSKQVWIPTGIAIPSNEVALRIWF